MADQFIGEIRVFTCNFAPKDWAVCDGTLLPIIRHQALFSLLSTRYGGNGTSTFALPDLRGKTTLQAGAGNGLTEYNVGDTDGLDAVALDITQIPLHTHFAKGKISGSSADPKNQVWANPAARPTPNFFATPGGSGVTMNSQALATAGSSAPHNNMMPYQVSIFCIALEGIYPSPW
jgi:microcystin-dependent protein